MDISKFFLGLKLDSPSSTPLYLQLAEYLAGKIKEDALLPGAKLPPERELASLTGVSRTTAINAYRHLEQQNLIRTKIGSGTFVAENSSAQPNNQLAVPWSQLFIPFPQSPVSSILRELMSTCATDDNISFSAGMPDPAFYPLETLKSLINEHSNLLKGINFGHLPTEGYEPLRHTIAAMLASQNIAAQPENIMVLSGSQQGLYLISKAMLEPGDYVVMESPSYIGANQTFQNTGARLLTLPASGSLNLNLLEDFLIRYRPKLIYLIPTFQNPTGRVIPENDRKAMLQLALRHRVVIVEDDPYGQLYYEKEPPLSLKSLDSYGGVIYLSTFSKVLFPGLRTGFIAADPVLINRLAREKQYIDLHSSNLSQLLVHNFLTDGYLPGHLKKVRDEYRKKRDTMARAIKQHCGDEITFTLPGGGFYLWCHLHAPLTSRMLLHETAKTGISFVPGEAFYASTAGEQELRLCFTSQNVTLISEGIRRLAKTLAQLSKTKKSGASLSTASIRPII
jgi:DNA-binding transcriptional MocR family regulator